VQGDVRFFRHEGTKDTKEHEEEKKKRRGRKEEEKRKKTLNIEHRTLNIE